MLRSILRDRLLLLLLSLAVLIRVFSLRSDWVERFYTGGFYPYFSEFLRFLFGWIPFSLGDLLYLAAFIFLIAKTWKLLRLLAKRQVKEYLSWILFRKYLRLVLWIYLVFNIFWGLNYNRQGIAYQLGLHVQPYDSTALYQLTTVLEQRLNDCAAHVDTTRRLALNKNENLFEEGIGAYGVVRHQYPFLYYRIPSIKPSIYSSIGHYFGFTGYYNPFTGEAQLKTLIPVFTKPFIVCHEMAHQLGYARENEANFVGFLAARTSHNLDVRYSAYYDMFTYALGELIYFNLPRAKEIRDHLHPLVKEDFRAYRAYIIRTQNGMEPIISSLYDRYLRLNNQPKGTQTYNEVVLWLIAYMKKYGEGGI
jgi:Protein of unknown function (DUF3810)